MKTLSIFLISFLFLQACKSTMPCSDCGDDNSVKTLKNINRYFHKDVIPSLKDPWSKLSEKGRITFEYIYEKNSSGNWSFNKISIDTTTISGKSTQEALKIMQNAVTNTEFRIKHGETEKQLFLYYTWPVPFPEGTFDETTAIFKAKNDDDEVPSGCDGHGTPPQCFSIKPKCCTVVCVGFKRCTQFFYRGQKGCKVTSACASGGPFMSGYVMQ